MITNMISDSKAVKKGFLGYVRPTIFDRGNYCSTPSAAQTIQICGSPLRQGSVAISGDEHRALQRLYGYATEAPRKRPDPPVRPRREDFPAGPDGNRAFDDAESGYEAAYASWEAWVDPQRLLQSGADVAMLRYAEVDGLRIVAWLARLRGAVPAGSDPLKAVVRLAMDAGLDVDPADVDWVENDESSEEKS